MSLNDIPIGKTLSDVLATSDANLTQYLENQEKFMKQIVDRHLGLYTDEQEADDMEAELSFRMGFTAKEIIGAELAFQKVSEKEWREDYRPGTIYPKPYMDECERLLLNNWKDSPYIGIGNFDDNHH